MPSAGQHEYVVIVRLDAPTDDFTRLVDDGPARVATEDLRPQVRIQGPYLFVCRPLRMPNVMLLVSVWSLVCCPYLITQSQSPCVVSAVRVGECQRHDHLRDLQRPRRVAHRRGRHGELSWAPASGRERRAAVAGRKQRHSKGTKETTKFEGSASPFNTRTAPHCGHRARQTGVSESRGQHGSRRRAPTRRLLFLLRPRKRANSRAHARTQQWISAQQRRLSLVAVQAGLHLWRRIAARAAAGRASPLRARRRQSDEGSSDDCCSLRLPRAAAPAEDFRLARPRPQPPLPAPPVTRSSRATMPKPAAAAAASTSGGFSFGASAPAPAPAPAPAAGGFSFGSPRCRRPGRRRRPFSFGTPATPAARSPT